MWIEGLALVCITVPVVFFISPLPWYPDEALDQPAIYLIGVWAALVCGLIFNGFYAWRVAEETRRMSNALAATEMILAREQQLSALDGLAAAAAHELGTPLATIALVAKELKRELPDAPAFNDDLDLLYSQAQRCRQILSTLTNHPDDGDAVFARMRLSAMLEEIVEPLRTGEVEILVTQEGEGDEPEVLRNPGMLHGLGNLLDNAADFAKASVRVSATWNEDMLAITIEDDGPGFAQEIIDKLGEPYVTTRGSASRMRPGDAGHEGMGLGFFIAKTLLERSGAWVTLANQPLPDHGAIVRIEWSSRLQLIYLF